MKRTLLVFGTVAITLSFVMSHPEVHRGAKLHADAQVRSEYFDFSKSLDESFVGWQDSYKIEITSDARKLIKEGFLKQAPYLERTFTRLELKKDGQFWLFGTLVEQYLCDLRDIDARRLGANPAASADPLRRLAQSRLVASSFKGDSPQFVPEVVKITIEIVSKFPVDQFFKQMRQVLDGPKPGRLEVASTPDKASITIDGEDRGNTCKPFVVSPGNHQVTVHKDNSNVDCKAEVNVGEGKTERFCCPKGSGCPKWHDGKKCTAP